MVTCKICSKTFTPKGIGSHMWRAHTTNGQVFTPNVGHKAWNAGLNKESDSRVLQYSSKSGPSISAKLRGRTLSDSHKENVSLGMRRYYSENPDKFSFMYTRKNGESYPEKMFRLALVDSNITGWVQHYKKSVYEYDFAFPDLKIDVEIDGHTHNTERVKKIDTRRDEYALKEGWTVIRFTTDELHSDLNACIEKLGRLIQR